MLCDINQPLLDNCIAEISQDKLLQEQIAGITLLWGSAKTRHRYLDIFSCDNWLRNDDDTQTVHLLGFSNKI